jgi:hypothetical protein
MIKQEQQIVLRTFTVIGVIALLVICFSCNKEEPQPTSTSSCECFETYENLEPVIVNGLPQNQWVFDYTTPIIPAPCTNASGWVYMSNGTKRYKTDCQ